MKVLLIDSTEISQAPYLEIYTQIFDKQKVEWDIFTWNKDINSNLTYADHVYTAHKKMHLRGIKKYYDFYRISKLAKKLICNHGYTHLVIINTIWATLLCKQLEEFKNRYILDVRDYKMENKPCFSWILKRIVNHSYATVISSEGFREFMPENDKLLVAHNLMADTGKSYDKPSLNREKLPIKIGFVGYVRYNEPNRGLIKCLKNNLNYEIHYYGALSRYCDFHIDSILKSDNVFMHGKYDNKDKDILYKNIDIINALSGMDNESRWLTPNRLYDALLYKKPLIALPGTYLGKFIKKYGIGVAIDPDDKNFEKLLDKYINNFDEKEFSMVCDSLLKKVKKENLCFLNTIANFGNSESRNENKCCNKSGWIN